MTGREVQGAGYMHFGEQSLCDQRQDSARSITTRSMCMSYELDERYSPQ